MIRRLASLLVLTLGVGLAWALAQIPEALSKVEAFRIREIRLEGNRFLQTEDAAKTVAISPLASVWDDLDPLEERLRSHPLVEDVKAHRRFPGTLVLDVVERQPVALVGSPVLEPVDSAGSILPIDPAEHHLDLPLITPVGRGRGGLSAAERHLVAGELTRLAQGDPEILARISEVGLDSRGDLQLWLWYRPGEEDTWDRLLTLHLSPNLPMARIEEGFRALGDAMNRFDGAQVAAVDLRYQDQVVVRLSGAAGSRGN